MLKHSDDMVRICQKPGYLLKSYKNYTTIQVPGVVKETAVPQAVHPSGWRMEET